MEPREGHLTSSTYTEHTHTQGSCLSHVPEGEGEVQQKGKKWKSTKAKLGKVL